MSIPRIGILTNVRKTGRAKHRQVHRLLCDLISKNDANAKTILANVFTVTSSGYHLPPPSPHGMPCYSWLFGAWRQKDEDDICVEMDTYKHINLHIYIHVACSSLLAPNQSLTEFKQGNVVSRRSEVFMGKNFPDPDLCPEQ